jgi:hypothetical protein
VGGVEAINDLATIYTAGGTVIVTEILAYPWAESQPWKSHITKRARGSKIDANFVTFLFGAQYLLQRQGPTDRWVLGDRETRNVGSRLRRDAIGVVSIGHD